MMSRIYSLFLFLLFQTVSSSSSFTPGLNFTSSAPHIFASVFGLLQQWSNSFFPYGHSIVPCEIPGNVNLYHARIDGDLPTSPEWFALDWAMSVSIAGGRNDSRLLTYRTTRKIRCIYFDGASASLNGAGNMLSQMVNHVLLSRSTEG